MGRKVYFTSPPNAPRTIWPRMPALRPLPKIALEASRTAMLVAVRAADLTIVVPIVSLCRAGVFGTGEDVGAGWLSRSRGSGVGLSEGALHHGPVGTGRAAPAASCSAWPPVARPISTS